MEIKYNSIFKEDINNFILYEKAMNYKNTNEKKLKDLDNYFINIKKVEKKITESDYHNYIFSYNSNLSDYDKYQIILKFSKFLIRFGNTNVFFEEIKFHNLNQYEPHIYTKLEIKKILYIIDNKKYKNDIFKFSYPVIFRLLISTGMRISEALNLKYRDIDLDNDSIDIILSKENISRRIYISISLKKTLEKYFKLMSFNEDDKLFNSSKHNILLIFKSAVKEAKIKTNVIRLHDLRHSMAVRALDNLIKENIEVEEALLYLEKYMGHSKVSSTEYYLHMTENMQNDIKNKMKLYCPNLYPNIKDGECNE